jgi:hypothetical protein
VGDILRKDSYTIYIGNWSRITEVPCHSSLEDVLVRFIGNTTEQRSGERKRAAATCLQYQKTSDHVERGR